MKADLRSFSVSIVDFLGAFLPGIVWLILFLTFAELVGDLFRKFWLHVEPRHYNTSPLEVTNNLLHKGTAFYVAFSVGSALVGLSIKVLVMKPSEFLSSIDAYYKAWRRSTELKHRSDKQDANESQCESNDRLTSTEREVNSANPVKTGWSRIHALSAQYRFPYCAKYEKKPYYAGLVKNLKAKLACLDEGFQSELSCTGLPGSPPFSSCRRLLRAMSPSLWEETEHREAEARMIGSLFLGTIFSLWSATIAVLLYRNPGSFAWLLISFVAVLFFFAAFRKCRRREVEYTYLNYLVAAGPTSQQGKNVTA